MATQIKTLASGLLKDSNSAFSVGERILYAAPHPSHPDDLGAIKTAKKAAFITAIRLFNTYTGVITFQLHLVRYDATKRPQDRTPVPILPFMNNLNPSELRVDTLPLVLEEGDLLIGTGAARNFVNYVISGIEQDV
jgi:hypothetical protein